MLLSQTPNGSIYGTTPGGMRLRFAVVKSSVHDFISLNPCSWIVLFFCCSFSWSQCFLSRRLPSRI